VGLARLTTDSSVAAAIPVDARSWLRGSTGVW
jgi:hypothetical protein